jgi:hypothetical protein
MASSSDRMSQTLANDHFFKLSRGKNDCGAASKKNTRPQLDTMVKKLS